MELSEGLVNGLLRDAVKHFWKSRSDQASQQKKAGRSDQGFRGAVTGGAQMDGFIFAFEALVKLAGIPDAAIYTRSRFLELPGYFRPTKEWDMLVVRDGALLGVFEAKSQVGPSFSNNMNNRAEEAMGSALDLWTAFRENAFQRAIRPWAGYLFLLEDCPKSSTPISVREPHFKVFPEFQGASYAKRYEILCQKLILERYYDAAALILSSDQEGKGGKYTEPNVEVGFRRFARSLVSHMESHKP